MDEELKNIIFIFNRYAQTYEEKYQDINRYQSSLDLLLGKLSEKSQVLELGCGPGNITQYLNHKRPDLELVATDLAEDMLEIAQKKLPSVNFEIFNFKELDSYPITFDALVAAFCLPYLDHSETAVLLHSAYEKMNENGLLYISTMEGKHKLSGIQKSSSKNEEMMIYFYEENWLIEQIERVGFRVKYSELIPQPVISKSTGQDVVIIAQK